MKKLFLATISLAALAANTPASAADMAVKGVSRPAPRCAQFGGFYVGGHAGWTFHDSNWVDRDAWVDNFNFDWALGSVSRTQDGFSGGCRLATIGSLVAPYSE